MAHHLIGFVWLALFVPGWISMFWLLAGWLAEWMWRID